MRICLAAQNKPVQSRAGKIANSFKKNNFDSIIPDTSNYRKYVFGVMAFEKISQISSVSSRVKNFARYAIICVLSNRFDNNWKISEYDSQIETLLSDITSNWSNFEDQIRKTEENKRYYFKEVFNKETGEKLVETNWSGYYKGRTILKDLKNYFEF